MGAGGHRAEGVGTVRGFANTELRRAQKKHWKPTQLFNSVNVWQFNKSAVPPVTIRSHLGTTFLLVACTETTAGIVAAYLVIWCLNFFGAKMKNN